MNADEKAKAVAAIETEVARLKEAGWTKADFAKALADMLQPRFNLEIFFPKSWSTEDMIYYLDRSVTIENWEWSGWNCVRALV